MDEREDKESKPDSAGPDKDDRWLPPRLRAKLQETEGEDDGPQKKSPAGAIVGVLILVVVAAGAWWLVHSMQEKAKVEAARVAAAAAARAAAVADSLARVHEADSLATVAREDSIAAFLKLPKWKQRQIIAQKAKAAAAAAGGSQAAAGGASPASAPPEPEPVMETGPFALDAGQFLFEDPAKTAATELKTATNLDAVVTAVGSGDNATYHVYLGRYSTRAAAEKAATDLLAKGQVVQARVVPIPTGQ